LIGSGEALSADLHLDFSKNENFVCFSWFISIGFEDLFTSMDFVVYTRF